MTVDCEREVLPEKLSGLAMAPSLTTPAGVEAMTALAWRRRTVLALNVLTWASLLLWAGSILRAGGWTWLDAAILACLALATPWPVLGFWNAVIGFWQLRVARGATSSHFLLGVRGQITVKTAVLMTLRNEDPVRALRRLRTIKESLDRTGQGQNFSYFVLSDSNRADLFSREEEAVAAWRAVDADRDRIIYRRRERNVGFKGGNVRDFAMCWGRDYDLMLPLDADSLLTGTAIVDLVCVMQRYPEIGILQSLVVGAPSASAFARIFQFGMRLAMRTYTIGQAWWVGDCGPYWGHNALLRVQPFIEHCALPVLSGKPPLGGDILSHDQVEAVLMRRGGFEVRVLPVEIGSYEDNPPDAIEFVDRDLRWCQGNMQYLKLFGLRGLEAISRYQLLWAVLMFLGVPAWIVLFALSPFAAAHAQGNSDFSITSAACLYVVLLVMNLAPKLAGLLDVAMMPGEVQRFGGAVRFGLSAVIEIVFSWLLAAMTSLRLSLFMAGLFFGRSVGWNVQYRDAHRLSWRQAASAFWPQFVFGSLVLTGLAIVSPSIALWSLPVTAGYVLAIPFAVLTASPIIGRFLQRQDLAAIPEDFAPPPEILAVQSGGP